MITGVVFGVLSSLMPWGMLASCQEGLFDLAYIDDTSQTEAEGLLADADLPIAESDAFKAWGKAFSDGFKDCMKEDFTFDWDKQPDYCFDGLHPTFFHWNLTNSESWGNYGQGFNVLQVQELNGFTVLKDSKKIEPDTAYWDETGKARFRISDTFSNSNKCDATCDALSGLNGIVTHNAWYGIFANLGIGDGWDLSHAVAAMPTAGHPATLNTYLSATESIPMEADATMSLPTKTGARMIDLVTFIYTPNAPTLGKVNLQAGEYAGLRQYLWDMGGNFLSSMAPAFGVSVQVTPALVKASSNGILGWGAMPIWVDPISSSPFTWDFVGGASARPKMGTGASPTAYVEEQMSSVFYYEGLAYVTQHYETFGGAITNTHSCAWDPDCPADCTIEGTANCQPLKAQGYDGGKIPGMYFYSPKGIPRDGTGFPSFTNFVLTYYLVVTMNSAGRIVIPVHFYAPDAKEGDSPAFEGHFTHSAYKAASYLRRLENCNYPGGRDLEGGVKDSEGLDCNQVKDTSPISPFFGLPLYWMVMLRNFAAPGWDSALTNAEDGAGATSLSDHAVVTSCLGQEFCSDALVNSKGPAFFNFLHYGYEPHLGALVDVALAGGLGWKWSPGPRHAHLMGGYRFLPLFWIWDYLHLPASINMDLAKLQHVPAALGGFYYGLILETMLSLVGGVACCACGV